MPRFRRRTAVPACMSFRRQRKLLAFVDFEDPGASSAALARICLDDAHAVALRAAGLIRAQDFSFSKLARERVSAVLEIAFSQREEG